ncbi:MAG: hypothetical protein ACFNJJ_07495 [Lachnoanaerobaculum saburreum]
MGLLRGIWRSTLVGRGIDTIRNVVDEGSVVDGIKRTVKEDFTEDNLIGKAIYDSGKYDGKKEGYVEASYEYKKKMIAQADEFLKQTRDFEKERNEYEALLDEYEREIDELESKVNKTQVESQILQQLISRESSLKKLAGA